MTSRRTKLIGISGCSNGGKTTLAKRLFATHPHSAYITQDNFYHPRTTQFLNFLPELDSFNFDEISAINMSALHAELDSLVAANTYEFIFIDGFLLYADTCLYARLNRKYFLYLDKETCLRRRLGRNYTTVDTPHYFDRCVWVEFLEYKRMCEQTFSDLVYVDGCADLDQIFNLVVNDLKTLN